MDQDAVHVHQVGLDRSLGGHAITRFRYGERHRGAIAGWPRSADGASGGSRARSGLGHPRTWRWPDPRATRRAGPPPLAVAPQLLGVLAEGGDQLILVHRRAALELQLSGPLAELLDAALLIGTPVELADLLGGLSLRGLRLLRIRLLLLSLDGFNEVLDSADALADGGLDRCHSGVDGLYGRVDLTGGDTGDGQRELALDGEGLLGDVEHAVHGAGEVDLGDRHPEGAGQLLGDGGPGADGVDDGGLALADGAQEVALGVGVGAGVSRHVGSSQAIRTMRSIVRICMKGQAARSRCLIQTVGRSRRGLPARCWSRGPWRARRVLWPACDGWWAGVGRWSRPWPHRPAAWSRTGLPLAGARRRPGHPGARGP